MTSLVCLAAVIWVVMKKLKITSKQRTTSLISRGWDEYLVDVGFKTGPWRYRAQCLLVAGITLHSLAPFMWNKSTKRLFGCKVVKSSLTNE